MNQGLDLFAQEKKANAAAALSLFETALTLNPNDDEARAACYNAACALTQLGRWSEAATMVERAVITHGLKINVAAKDDDLRRLRERKEWAEMVDRVEGDATREQYVKLRAEARAPFRFPRTIFFGGLLAGDAIGLLIILGRLAASLQGGEGAPDLEESLRNTAINLAVGAVLIAILWNDMKSGKTMEEKITREESLGRLECAAGGRPVLVASLRGQFRPLVLFGSTVQINRAARQAEMYKPQLQDRGVLLVEVPVLQVSADSQAMDESDRMLAALKSEFGTTASDAKSSSSKKGFDEGAGGGAGSSSSSSSSPSSGSVKDVLKAKKGSRWRVDAVAAPAWSKWLRDQPEYAAVGESAGDLLWMSVQMNGEIAQSGRGMPPFERLVKDIPPKESIMSKVGDGSGI